MLKNTQHYAIAFTKEDGTSIAFSCAQVWETQEGHLLIGVGQERTNYGSAFVQSIWFDRPVFVKSMDSPQIVPVQYQVWRCHITGSLFQEMLQEFRLLYPSEDLNIVWELVPATLEQQEKALMPKAFPPFSEVSAPLEWDCHLEF